MNLNIENSIQKSSKEIFNYWNNLFKTIPKTCHKSMDTKYSYRTEAGNVSIPISKLLEKALDKYGYDDIVFKIDRLHSKITISESDVKPISLGKFLVSGWLTNEIFEKKSKTVITDFKPKVLKYNNPVQNGLYYGIKLEELNEVVGVENHFNYFYQKGNTTFSDFFDLEHIIVYYLFNKDKEKAIQFIEIWKDLCPKYDKNIELYNKTNQIVTEERSFSKKIIDQDVLRVCDTWNKKGFEIVDIENVHPSICDKIQNKLKEIGVEELCKLIEEYIPSSVYENFSNLTLSIVLTHI